MFVLIFTSPSFAMLFYGYLSSSTILKRISLVLHIHWLLRGKQRVHHKIIHGRRQHDSQESKCASILKIIVLGHEGGPSKIISCRRLIGVRRRLGWGKGVWRRKQFFTAMLPERLINCMGFFWCLLWDPGHASAPEDTSLPIIYREERG